MYEYQHFNEKLLQPAYSSHNESSQKAFCSGAQEKAKKTVD